MMDYYLIGIGYGGGQLYTAAVAAILQQHHVFAGGHRHYTMVKDWLPAAHTWVPIKGNMEAVLQTCEQHEGPVVIFVSGDPYFYGFGNTLKRLRPHARVKAFPYFNAIQLLSHYLQLDYSAITTVTVHGRSWEALDEALIAGRPLIGVLTDYEKTPAAVAARMLTYGFTHYTMMLGEELEGPGHQVLTLSLEKAVDYKGHDLNCLILQRTGEANTVGVGIDDALFEGLPGRPGMITKSPIRLTTLSMLKLTNTSVFWDVGSCTGSVVIEAKRMFPALKAVAFEKRPECERIIQQNMQQLQAPGIQLAMGDIFDLALDAFARPDTIFIGGHGNRLEAMMQYLNQYLIPSGRWVMNTVKEDSTEIFLKVCKQLGYHVEPTVTITVNAFNPICILSASKPVV